MRANDPLTIIDLTRPIDENLAIYGEGEYSDPPVSIQSWSTIPEQGYWVSRVCLGTQTGTHIDAPAHFVEDAETLEQLPVRELIGRYFWLHLTSPVTLPLLQECTSGYADEPFLFLSGDDEIQMTGGALDLLCTLAARIWVIAQGVHIVDRDPLHFHRRLATCSKYLIEDLDPSASRRISGPGQLIALPLNLRAVSGAPCRVIAMPDPA